MSSRVPHPSPSSPAGGPLSLPRFLRRLRRTVRLVGTGVVWGLAGLLPDAAAQSVVVSVPNTDVTPRGTTMIAHESQVNARFYEKPYWNSFTFGTYGVGHDIELAATLYGVARPATENVALAVGYKQRIPLHRDPVWQPTIAFGPMLAQSLSGRGAGGWTYGVGSLRLPGLRTRFTVGPSYGARQIFGKQAISLLAAVEQPLHPRVSIIADWFSGDHDLAALVGGVQLNLSRSFILIAGVKRPNGERAGPVSGVLELTYDIHPSASSH